MNFALSKKTRILWQLRTILVAVLLCAVILFFSRYTVWLLLVFAALGAATVFVAFVYIPIYFKSYTVCIDDASISINKGVIIKTTQIMPFPRLVFAQSFATPLASAMGVKAVMLKAARGWLLIPEIESENANYLLENLKVRPK